MFRCTDEVEDVLPSLKKLRGSGRCNSTRMNTVTMEMSKWESVLESGLV